MPRLLLVVADPRLVRATAALLQDRYVLDVASSLTVAAEIAVGGAFDLIVIDAVGNVTSSLETCAGLRRRGIQTPILMLGTGDQVRDRVAAFKSGADDYLAKPVDTDELHIRIEALLRRSLRSNRREVTSYRFGGMRVNFRKSEISRNGSIVELSERESRLLQYFVENRGKVISRGNLLLDVWGYPRAPLTRTVDVHILRLRQKIEKDPKKPRFIVTVPGLGYRFDG